MTTNFPKLMSNHRSRKLGEHQTGKQTKNTPTPEYFKFKLQKTKNKGKIWKEVRGGEREILHIGEER